MFYLHRNHLQCIYSWDLKSNTKCIQMSVGKRKKRYLLYEYHHCMNYRDLKRNQDEEKVKAFLSIQITLNFINFEF